MIITLEEARTNLGYEEDYTEADINILPLVMATENYLKNGGCVLNPDDELAKLAVKMLVNHWYNNREPIGKADLIPFGLKSIITQLKYCVKPITTTESGGTV